MTVINEGTVIISTESDIVTARKVAREKSESLSFSITDTTRIVTAVSELARNIFHYAGQGIMIWRIIKDRSRDGLEFSFEDNGPGILDIEKAMEIGYTTDRGLGMGLPGARRLMDDFFLESVLNEYTKVKISKWKRI
jgi:serine/threonine-protein kinase RsbT